MNLVCFPHYTAGALVCDLLNGTTGVIEGTKIYNKTHNIFKIGDNCSVFREFNEGPWLSQKMRLDNGEITGIKKSDNLWVGTHCHPGCIPKIHRIRFKKILSITTETIQSKFFRFLRIYHSNVYPDLDLRFQIKNVAEAFESHPLYENVEFEDIVSGKWIVDNGLNLEYYNQWKAVNNFLYENYDPQLKELFFKTVKEAEYD